MVRQPKEQLSLHPRSTHLFIFVRVPKLISPCLHRQTKKQAQTAAKAAKAAAAIAPVQRPVQPRVSAARKLRQKKGARRVKKAPVTLEQLDAEMAEYSAMSEEPIVISGIV